MKKLVPSFLLIACLVWMLPATAQQGLKIGAFVMPQNSMLLNSDDGALTDDEFQYELLGGMGFGVMAGWNPVENFGIRLNAVYSQQGGRHSVRSGVDQRDDYVTRLNYLKIPLMIGVNSNFANSKIVLSVYGGAQVAFLNTAFTYNNSVAYEAPLPETITDFPTVKARYENPDISVVGDVGVDIRLTFNTVLNLALRGEYSVQDTEDKLETFRLTEGGATTDRKYWEWVRGATKTAETRNLVTGLRIGVTYSFGQI